MIHFLSYILLIIMSIYFDVILARGGLLYPYGVDEGDSKAPSQGPSLEVNFTHSIIFYEQSYDHLHICNNGLLTFGPHMFSPYCEFNAKPFPGSMPAVIAPFWILQVTFTPKDENQNNLIYWYNYWWFAIQDWPSYVKLNLSEKLLFRTTSDQNLRKRAARQIRKYFPSCHEGFVPKEILIVTWIESENLDYCENLSPEHCSCLFDNNPFEDFYDWYYVFRKVNLYCDCTLKDGRNADVCECILRNDYREDYCICMFEDENRGDKEKCLSYIGKRSAIIDNDLSLPKRTIRESNTYQVVVMTDGKLTYVMLNYKKINWVMSRGFRYGQRPNFYDYPFKVWAGVGFNKGDGKKGYNHPFSGSDDLYKLATDSNVNVPGRWVYQVNKRRIRSPDCTLV